jgi:hypothetical protein
MKKSLLLGSLAAVCLLFTGQSASAQAIVNGATYKITHYGVKADNGEALCIEVAGNSGDAGAAVQQWYDNGNDAQRFIFELQTDGSYKLRHKGTNMYIQTTALSSQVFTQLEQGVSTDDDAQRWVITENSGSTDNNPNPPANGLYEFKLKKAVGQVPFEMCMEVPDGNNIPGQRIKLFDDNDYAHAQRFQLALVSMPTAAKNANVLTLKTELYPNPLGRGQGLSMQVETVKNGQASVEIVDMLGHRVYRQAATLHTGANTLKLSNQALAAGIYVVRVQQGEVVQQTQLVQQ